MMIEKVTLLNTFKERFLCWVFLVFIFMVMASCKYMQYIKFSNEEFIKVPLHVVNVYEKEQYNVLRLKHEHFTLFTSVNKNFRPKVHEQYEAVILTSNIGFIDYIRGFYTKSILYKKLEKKSSYSKISTLISSQHDNPTLTRLYQALFLAQPLPSNLRAFFANLGISHLIAISGFHLSVLSVCLYFIISLVYKPLHQVYFPYRNRKFDVLILIVAILFGYLVLTGFVPSLLRAFLMMLFGLILLRHNIELFSYETLLLTFGCIVALFPEYLFAIALWFSITAVFYIFLFLQYMQSKNKIIMAIVFNIWIFLVFNPIVHFFFANTSYEQLTSPILTLLFTLFYPLVLFLHVIYSGNLLDEVLNMALQYEITSFEVWTPWWFFILYCAVSLAAVLKKEAFYVLNILMIGFNLYLFV